jgi:uncharacterized lipoprotein YddW (UPF0748 family)
MVHQGLKRRQLLAGGTLAAGTLLLSGCSTLGTAQPLTGAVPQAPDIPREFRAAWVATVANIDWPSKRTLTTPEAQAEVRATVQRAAALGLNALVLQVRTSADALYPSALEPWSEYLTGTQGLAPAPAWDPLALWIHEAHAAGLELHAWFNPYRARQSNAQSAQHPSHLSATQPDWVKTYGKQLWIDPGEPGAVAHTLAVFRDVLRRYPVDALHIDDYFYPYPEKDATVAEVDFPDEASWQRYGVATGLGRADWRRNNVDRLVKAMFDLTREARPGTRLGISPFGIMKPSDRPPGIAGFSQYDKLYADVERWLREGWLDYLVPQLYWPRAQAPQAFGPLLQGWMGLNPQKRHIWAGLYTSRINDTPQSWVPDEITGQIALTRELNPSSGHVHFSMVALNQNRKGVTDALRATSYPTPALPPATPWVADDAPPPLRLWQVRPDGGPARWSLATPDNAAPHRAWLWWRVQGQWRGQLIGPSLFDWPEGADTLVASAIGRNGVEGARGAWTK